MQRKIFKSKLDIFGRNCYNLNLLHDFTFSLVGILVSGILSPFSSSNHRWRDEIKNLTLKNLELQIKKVKKLMPSRVNFNKILRAAFTHADPKSAKKDSHLKKIFVLLKSAWVTAVRKMLMKLIPSLQTRRSRR